MEYSAVDLDPIIRSFLIGFDRETPAGVPSGITQSHPITHSIWQNSRHTDDVNVENLDEAVRQAVVGMRAYHAEVGKLDLARNKLARIADRDANERENLESLSKVVANLKQHFQDSTAGLQKAYESIMKTIETKREETKEELDRAMAEFDDFESRVNALRKVILDGLKEFSKDKDLNVENIGQFSCPVCFDRTVDMCHIPCGHTLCSACERKNREVARLSQATPRCHMCRALCTAVELKFSCG